MSVENCQLSYQLLNVYNKFIDIKIEKDNKRPSGLDALLGYLLNKRTLAMVWCKLTVVAVQRSLKI